MITPRTIKLTESLRKLYSERSHDVLFHGWHHIYFVTQKAVSFAQELEANVEIVQAAALTHDTNYLVRPNSQPEVGATLRAEYLSSAGFANSEIDHIESIISNENLATRGGKELSDETKALSDADTLFKALPVTPILLAGRYLTENHVDIGKLADQIMRTQKPLMDAGLYFYTKSAKQQYLLWAKTNIQLWENVQASLKDKDVQDMLSIAREMKAI